ncbi:MAG: hypothetical protein Q9216_006251 [Gyalolechia sp. 2 TL-2023]
MSASSRNNFLSLSIAPGPSHSLCMAFWVQWQAGKYSPVRLKIGICDQADEDVATQPALPSRNGAFIAAIDRSQLVIRSSKDALVVQKYDLPSGFATSCRFIRWWKAPGDVSTPRRLEDSMNHDKVDKDRLILADNNRIVVYDIEKPQVYAEISGATCLTKLANVDFGRIPDEVMVLSDFGFKLQLWSLTTKRAFEVKDPKQVPSYYSYRPSSGHLALLTRTGAYDILLIMAPSTYEVLTTSELPTVDVCGVRYSPDGNWLVVWDAASAGCRVLLLTADGHLYRTYSLPQEDLNLGVRCVEWSPDGECLAVGDYEGRVTILDEKTFMPRLTFIHRPTIDDPNERVWQEELGPSRTRGYAEATQPAISPSVDSFPSAKEGSHGITIMDFNVDGNLLASRDGATPSTLRIYAPKSGQSLAALIHHAPIKSIHWHPRLTDLLLIQCAIPEPTVYAWRLQWNAPKIFILSLKAPFGQLKSSWLSYDDENIRYMLGNTEQYAIGQFTPDGEEALWQPNDECPDGLGPEDMFDEGNSLDLSPVKMAEDASSDDTPALGLSTQLGYTSAIEDTFHYRHQSQANRKIIIAGMEDQQSPIKIAPPPWKCHYSAYIGSFYVSAKSGLPRDLAYEPLEASSSRFTEAGVWKGGLAMIQLLRYTSTPVGPYDEMILIPGNFDVPGGRGSYPRVTRIYVSQRDTTYNGRKNWNIPKHIARFKYTGDFSAPPFTVQLYPEDPAIDEPFFTASLQHLGFWTPTFPFSTNFLKRLGFPNEMVQPPLPEGEPKEVLCGTDAWYKLAGDIYSPKAKLVWMDLKQPGKEADNERENWWPGIKRWHLGVWLQDAELDFGEPEAIEVST